MRTISLILFFLLCLVSPSGGRAQSYPSTSYELSGSTLIRWIGTETDIDFSKDPNLRGVEYIYDRAFPGTVKRVTLPYRYGLGEPYVRPERLFSAPKNIEHLGWDDTPEGNQETFQLAEKGGSLAYSFEQLKSIHLPRQMVLPSDEQNNVILVEEELPHLEKISVSPKHQLYGIRDGILMSRDYKTIIRCPVTRKGNYEVPIQVEQLSPYAFGDSQLSSVAFSRTIKVIPERCFVRSNQLQTVLLPSGLEEIDAGAFSGCSQLRTIPLPASIATIKRLSFYKCKNLPSSIMLPGHLSNFAGSAYANSSVTQFSISADNNDFSVIDGVLYSKDASTLYAYPAERRDKEFTVPTSVTEIAPQAFYGQAYLEKIVLPEGLREIKAQAFRESTLRRIELPASVQAISYNAFSLNSLEHIVIHRKFDVLDWDGSINPTHSELLFQKAHTAPRRSVVVYENFPFPLLWEVNQPKRMAEDTLFVPRESIELYRIAPGWKNFGVIRAVEELPKPRVLPFILSNDKQTLVRWKGEETEANFSDYPELAQVRNIAAGAFAGLSQLQQVVAPNVQHILSAQSAEKGAFEECSSLGRVAMPQLESIGNGAFYACEQLRVLDMPEVKTVGLNALANCTALETASLPKVISIEGYAFNSCTALRTLKFSQTLQEIGDYAFSSCTALHSIDLNSSIPPRLGYGVWSGVNAQEVNLNVPTNVVEDYRAAYQWQDFKFPNSDPSGVYGVFSSSQEDSCLYDLLGRKQKQLRRRCIVVTARGKKKVQ